MATKSTKSKKKPVAKSTKKSTTKPRKLEINEVKTRGTKKPASRPAPKKPAPKASIKTIDNTVKIKKTSSDSIGKKIIKLVICVVLPLVVGGVSALVTGDMMAKFGELEQPILSPPEWLFPVAWTILYILMGLASFFILQQKPANKLEKGGKIAWLSLYGVQLVLNFMWPIFFFVMAQFNFALFWLLGLWVVILVLVFMANRHSQVAMWCMLPYALWVTFAAYLNLMIMMLN